ncbi:MAG: nuclear transport factor 2 family protein [Breznakibacter sp.]
MNKLHLSILIFMASTALLAQNAPGLSEKIIAMEKRALEQWNNGNPSGFLDISANDVVYFDPFTAQRLDGHGKLTELYEGIRGQVKIDRYEMVNPLVHAVENMAVLTFNLNSYMGTDIHKWNCTEVYRREADGSWKIIQTHWSLTQPSLR